MRVVYHCEDIVGARMAGPGIRAVELARRLAARHEVTLIAEGAESLRGEPFAPGGWSALQKADALITQGFGFPLRHVLRFRGRLVLDLYDPIQLEHLARYGPDASAEQRVSLAVLRRRLLWLISRADHLLCASAQQRALWLGWLGACGRLEPAALRGDPEARRLLATVPFGVPESPPIAHGHPLRDAIAAGDSSSRAPDAQEPGSQSARDPDLPDPRVPGSQSTRAPDARGASSGARERGPVALWSGGLWDWMDPLCAVRAHAIARQRVPDLRLALLAGKRPGSADMQMTAAAREARAAAGPGVHFIEEWIPYGERGAWLLDADLAVSAHKPSLEAELAFRTRLVDCLWSALPVAATAGDVLAAEGAQEGWARTAPPGDAQLLAEAMIALCDPAANARAREAARASAARRTWQRSADVLLDLLAAPPPARSTLAEAPSLATAAARKLLRKLF